MKRRRWGQKGFSLVEVTVAGAIVAGMGLVFATVLRTETRGWQASENQIMTSFELRRCIHAMAQELAQTNTAAAGGNLQVFVGGGWAPWAADGISYPRVRFRVPEDRDGNGTVLDAAWVPEWSASSITYGLGGVNGQELQRMQMAPPPLPGVRTLAYGVTALSFRRLVAPPNNSMVEVSVTVQRGAANPGAATSGEAQPVTLSTRIRLRN